jgi:hypothetical protein
MNMPIHRLIKIEIKDELASIVDILYDRHVLNMVTNPLTAAINASKNPILFEYCARKGIIDVHVEDKFGRTLYAYVKDMSIIRSLMMRGVDAKWFTDSHTDIKGMVLLGDEMGRHVKYIKASGSTKRWRKNRSVYPRDCHEPVEDSSWCPSEWRCWDEL